jgi:uncharacterized DUF497 family protein
LPVAGFEWDGGNRDKCQKYGVTIPTTESVFDGAVAVFPDPADSLAEERFTAIARSSDKRNVLIAFTLRRRGNDLFIRPVSARYMHKKEIAYYEAEASKAPHR